jgi:glutaredoxin-dependent peroxiredoxin
MALKLGDRAHHFTLFDTDRKERTLQEFLGKKTVIAFFPGAFTGVCTKELCTFRDSLANFEKLNAQVVAVSVDSPFANKAFAEANKLTFPILSDYRRSTIKQYSGIHEDFAGLISYTVSKRAVFVLDKDRIIKYCWISEDPAAEPPYAEIDKALASF